MLRIARLLVVFVVLLATVTVLPALAGARPKEIVIGVLYPMTGPNAQPGIDNKPVIDIGTDIANGVTDLPFPFYQKLKGMPGLKGAKVRVILADHQGKPELGQSRPSA
jgi:branched-chain amino acid transport system substrate-binding protein